MTITGKKEMYELLQAGKLGNTVDQFFSFEDWVASDAFHQSALWGIRSCAAGNDKRMRLNVHRDDVENLYKAWFGESGGNISPMVDHAATLKAMVFESDFAPCGLQITYADCDPVIPWREAFRYHSRDVSGAVAMQLLRHHLTPDDFDWLMKILETYPMHVVEFTALRRPMGRVPGSRMVMWEVRKY